MINRFGNQINGMNTLYVEAYIPGRADQPFSPVKPTGNYTLSDIIGPKSSTYIFLKDTRQLSPLGAYEIKFSKYELNERIKNYDIAFSRDGTIDVFGTVKDYCGQRGIRAEPVIGAIIELGGRQNLTNENGEYLIANVPKDTTKFSIRSITGFEKLAI